MDKTCPSGQAEAIFNCGSWSGFIWGSWESRSFLPILSRVISEQVGLQNLIISFVLAEVGWQLWIALQIKTLNYNYESEFLNRSHFTILYSRRGSLAPWSLRLLLAELPMYNNKQVLAMNKMFKLRRMIQQIISNLEKGLNADGEVMLADDAKERRRIGLEMWKERERQVWIKRSSNCNLISLLNRFYTAWWTVVSFTRIMSPLSSVLRCSR